MASKDEMTSTSSRLKVALAKKRSFEAMASAFKARTEQLKHIDQLEEAISKEKARKRELEAEGTAANLDEIAFNDHRIKQLESELRALVQGEIIPSLGTGISQDV